MASAIKIESGLDLIARLCTRPNFQQLDRSLFFDDLDNADIVEITGSVSSGKTALLTKLIEKCLLICPYFGKKEGNKVLLINTNNHFKISTLRKSLMKKFCASGKTDENVDILSILDEKLKIINCLSYEQLLMTLVYLENILVQDRSISVLAINSITSYFWQQQNEFGISSYDIYLRKLLNTIKRVTQQFRILTFYVRGSDFESKRLEERTREFLKYQIKLDREEKVKQFVCFVKSSTNNVKTLKYKIDDFGLHWLDS